MGYNPLEYPYQLYKQNKIDETIKYLEQFSMDIFGDDNYNDPFWENSARSLFIGLALSLYEDAKENEIHLVSISYILEELNSNINDVKEYFRRKDKNSAIYTCVSSTIFAPEETKGGIVSFAQEKLRPFVDREYLNLLLSKTSFPFTEIYKKNTAIFLICEEEDNEITPLLSTIIKQVYYYLSKQILNKSFNFILDNFDIIKHFNNLKEILSSSISKNIKFILTTRDKQRLEEKYSNYMNKISNDIEVTEKEVVIKINGETTVIKNEKIIRSSLSQVVYPILKNRTLNIFNIKGILQKIL